MIDLNGVAVLVVEDQPALLRFLGQVLEMHQATVFLAENAAAGLAHLQQREGKVSLAVIDMVMPGESGLDLASEMQRSFPDIPILYISGYVDSIAMDVIARRSPDSVLLKPFTPQVLVDRIALLLRKRSQFPTNPANERKAS